jgi:hypothetical protein
MTYQVEVTPYIVMPLPILTVARRCKKHNTLRKEIQTIHITIQTIHITIDTIFHITIHLNMECTTRTSRRTERPGLERPLPAAAAAVAAECRRQTDMHGRAL